MGQRWLPLALIVAALIAVGVGASVSGVSTRDLGPPPEVEQPLITSPSGIVTPLPEPTAELERPIKTENATFWLSNLGWIVAAAALFYLLIWALRRLVHERWARRSTAEPLKDRPEAEEVHAAVLAALADLEEDGDARRAVIACWLRLERAAHGAGTPRLAGDSPADLVTRLLAGHDVDGAALEELADVYRLARYSGHEITEEHRQAARRALSALGAGLRV